MQAWQSASSDRSAFLMLPSVFGHEMRQAQPPMREVSATSFLMKYCVLLPLAAGVGHALCPTQNTERHAFGRGILVEQGARDMKISARNVLKGKIVDVHKGATIANVKIDIGGTVLTASITNESVDALGLSVGKDAYAVIKASEVMVGID
jgi:molybdopterin-binding protein